MGETVGPVGRRLRLSIDHRFLLVCPRADEFAASTPPLQELCVDDLVVQLRAVDEFTLELYPPEGRFVDRRLAVR